MNAHRVAIGLLVAVLTLTSCGKLQEEGDTEAARVADHILPDVLQKAIDESGAATPRARASFADDWLTAQGTEGISGQQPVIWEVRGRDGTHFRVDLYVYWYSVALFPPEKGKAVWGRACRDVDVSRGVQMTAIKCPRGTPKAPKHQELD